MAGRRPVILPKELETEALAILDKHGLSYNNGTFSKPKINPTYQWDRNWIFRFFSDPHAINGCCGVIEMASLAFPYNRYFENNLTLDEWSTLFQFNVRDVLDLQRRRMALITTINSQRNLVPFVEAAGFKVVETGYNPSTRHKVTVWTLSI